MLCDSYNREINYLRLSVTRRCNLGCRYCASPAEEGDDISIGQMARIVRVLAGLGIKTVRLTGGEPLIRPDVASLVRMLKDIRGIAKIGLTTNGVYLKTLAKDLFDAGLDSINIHIDSLDPHTYGWVSRGAGLEDVIAGLNTAINAGFKKIKLNSVLMRGVNDHEVPALTEFASKRSLPIRFIELMPIGNKGFYKKYFIPMSEAMTKMNGKLLPINRRLGSGPAKYYKVADSKGAIVGFISSSRMFCDSCNRLRLTADGDLRNCLGHQDELPLADLLPKLNDDRLSLLIQRYVSSKPKDHAGFIKLDSQGMNSIGG